MSFSIEAQNLVAQHRLLKIHTPGGELLAVFGTHDAVSQHPTGLEWAARGRWVLLDFHAERPLIHSYDSVSSLVFAVSSRFAAELRALIRRHRYWSLFPLGSSIEWPSKPLREIA